MIWIKNAIKINDKCLMFYRRSFGQKNSLSLPPENRTIDFSKEFEQQDMKYDSTGMFHWCPARTLEECVLVSKIAQNYIFD